MKHRFEYDTTIRAAFIDGCVEIHMTHSYGSEHLEIRRFMRAEDMERFLELEIKYCEAAIDRARGLFS